MLSSKGQALKSLVDMNHYAHLFGESGEEIVTAYKKLAELEPKLTSLQFNPHMYQGFTPDMFEMVKPFLFTVLQCSRETLESLSMCPLRSAEFLPKLKGLKELELLLCSYSQDGVFFPSETPVTEIFPNVSEIVFKSKRVNEEYINRYLPESIISPWGAQIHRIEMGHLEESCIPMMQRLFPFIQELELEIYAPSMADTLVQLSLLWPQLKHLTILVLDVSNEEPNLRLDHAFTGLPEEVIDQLGDPFRKMNFTPEEIQGFKDQSIMRKFEELKDLTLYRYSHGGNKYLSLTPIANEFGFQLLPGLRVTVEEGIIGKGYKIDAELWALCDNILIVDDL